MDPRVPVAESEVDAFLLQKFFRAAFLKTEIDDDGDLRVYSDFGCRVYLNVDPDRKLVRFTSVYGLREDASEEDKLRLVNTLNDKVILARFSMPQSDALMADYYLLYEEGLIPYQVVHTFRQFARVVVQSLREYDVEDLVE
ncbi:signal transduction inhibitor [Isosphaera pallida ATCC 43644]|jgi:hypothetical protein|uniref:Signal transduction inhibitor n=1 Tax=Isosphaera pallida (strain ATCC 43644 / DSM 9630 / IS1B) TaxID=575540 RepID=E8QYH0_ISOPI|nr:YbjN domain-containing protein [Isosphaera pallida]ADV64153.1 signal transduction inhibitor [Isosphaera pallida ATCC 43644]